MKVRSTLWLLAAMIGKGNNMLKAEKLILCLAVLQFVFCLGLSGIAAAESGICAFPTLSGDWEYPPDWPTGLVIDADFDTVDRNDYVEVWVDSGSLGCPPYNWSVAGTGFHFYDVNGPTTATTDNNSETLQLWADDTASGSATITVTDGCGGNEIASVREPNHGKWVLLEELTSWCDDGGADCEGSCSENNPGCRDGPAGWLTTIIIGKMRYNYRWPSCRGDWYAPYDCNPGAYYWHKFAGPWSSRCASFTSPTHIPPYGPTEVPGTGNCNPYDPGKCKGSKACVWEFCDVYEWRSP